MKLVDEINEQLEKVSEVKLLTPEENLRDRNWNRAPDGDWTHPAFRGACYSYRFQSHYTFQARR
jgi:hypothetical protein